MRNGRTLTYAIWFVSTASLGLAFFPLRATSASLWDFTISILVLVGLAFIMSYLAFVFPARGKEVAEKWLINLSYWIPRKYREAITGDILEDCRELRVVGKSEWRIRIHVIWQLAWALILLRPSALVDVLKRVLSTK
jgi:hypothetical protein